MTEFKQGQWPDIEGEEFLLNLGDQWLYEPSGDSPHFGTDKPVKWRDAKRHLLSHIIKWVDYWRCQGKDAYAAHFGSGSILCVDFDDRPSDPDAHYGEGQTLEMAQAAYDELFNYFRENTYTEKSRTEGRYHALLWLPEGHGLPMRQIKGLHGIDLLIGNGWVRLSGNSNGLSIADIPQDLLAQLQGVSKQYNFDGVPHSAVQGDPALCAMTLHDATFETRRRMLASTSKTQAGFTYQQLIEGPAALDDSNLSESRAALIQWAAKISCGHAQQHEIVWRIVSGSYLADQTPFVSNSNPRRFTNPSKINYDRFHTNGEYHKLIGIANREVEAEKQEADAQRERMAVIAEARKAKKLTSRDYWQRQPLDDFPVPVYRHYRDWLRASSIKSNERIIEAATLAHMGHLLGNKVAGPTGVFPAIFIIVPAPAGGGKEAASYEVMQRLAPEFTFSLGSPGSGGGFHSALLDPRCHGVGFAMIDEYQDFLMGKGDNQHVKSSVTTLKTVYGKMQIGKELPAVRLVKDTRPPVPEPAVTMLGIGIEDEVFEAFAKTSLSDGFFARHLFPDMANELGRFRNRRVATDPPTQLLATIAARLADLPKPPNAPFARSAPERIWFESEELEDEAYQWACEIDDLREEKHAGTRFGEMLRAVAENTHRLATGMAAWADERKITRTVWEWCKGYAINSVAYLLAKDEAGAMDADTPALAQRIHKAMDQFFDGKGNQHSTQWAMRNAGQFRLGSLPNYPRIEEAAAKINRANPMMPLEAAISVLKGRRIVEVFNDERDFTKRVYCKGPAYDEAESD